MPNYNQAHQFYAGVDLHARSMFVHVLNARGKTVYERDLPAAPAVFLDAVQPFRKDLVVGCECMFAWYWLADLCEEKRIPFVLGHALAMKHIHGGFLRLRLRPRTTASMPASWRPCSAAACSRWPTSTPRPSGRRATCSAAAVSSSASRRRCSRICSRGAATDGSQG